MTVSASTQIPKTSDPAVFQRQCKVLFEHVLGDPNVQEYGSSGQGQKGVDLLGRRRDVALDHWVGIQCKLTIKAEKLKKGTVREEAEAALAFEPKLKEYILATTANDDAVLHAEAASITDEQAKLGRDFTIQVWGWQALTTHILQFQAAIEAFSPDAFPHLRRIDKGQERLSEQVETNAAIQIEMLQRIEQQTAVSAGIAVSTSTVWDDSSVGTLLDRQIDQYRDMLKTGQPCSALRLLQNLWNELPSGAESRIRFRVRSNIAACKLRMGDEKAAGADYLEAYNYTPDDATAVALKVLGLILLGHAAKAWEFGLASLGVSGDRGSLIAHLITAARSLPEVENALDVIPPDFKTNPVVEVAQIDYLRFRPEHGDWTRTAQEACVRHPDDKNLARLAAEAEIADACTWSDENEQAILPRDIRKSVATAVGVLRDEWDRVLRSEASRGGFTVSLCANLVTGYRLLHCTDAAMEVVAEGLKLVPDSQALIELQFLIALEQGDSDTTARLLDRIPPSRDKIFGQLQLGTNAGDWGAVEALAETTDISSYEIDDKALFESLALLARCELGHVDDPKASVSNLLNKYENQVIVPTVLYEVARNRKDKSWANDLYQTALGRRASLRQPSRLMLARIAEREDDAEVVIGLLYGHVDTDRDTEELRSLARGFVNASVRSTTLDFIRSLPTGLKATPFYSRVIGSIHFNSGALKDAANAFHVAIDADPGDLVAHLGLINTWLRQDREDLVEERLGQIDPRQLNGPPVQKMGLAQLLVAFGRPDVGLTLGYETALDNRDELRVAQLYIGLILSDPMGALIPSVGAQVQVDYWVRLKGGDDRALSVVIEDGRDRPSIDHYSPNHSLAKAILGHTKNDVIELTPQIGTAQSWHIAEIKHKFVALLHDIMETLQSRFPEARGFYTIKGTKGDLTPILDEVRKLSEHDDHIFDNYLQNGFPLALASAILGKCSVEFAANVIRRGEVVRTCIGTHEERDEAMHSIDAAADRGVVLDTYTAWIAHSLGVIPVLKSMFTRVALAQFSLDELREWRSQFQLRADDEPLMTIGYLDDQYFREEIPTEQLKKSAALINAGIDKLQAELEILPAVAPSAPSKLESALLEIVGHGLLDPIYVSAAENLLLLSDDLHYRNVAHSARQCAGIWLQPVLMLATDTGKMTAAAYADAVANLAIHKHNHIALNALTLIEIAKADDTEGMQRFKAAVDFIGIPTAEFKSHVTVSWDFLKAIFHTSLPRLRREAAAGAVLERLRPLLSRYDQLVPFYRAMIDDSVRWPLLREYLIGWARGHFLNIV